MSRQKDKIYVVGHKNPDTDSICSAIAYAALKTKLTGHAYEPRRAGQLNEETQYVLEKFAVKPPKLLSDLREQIKGSGIETSATRAEILKKLFNIKYLALNKKTQVITPTLLGEMIYDVVLNSIRSLLNPELTASWEKGLNYVAEGEITSDEYMTKLDHFIVSRTNGVLGLNNQYQLRSCYDRAAAFYKKETKGRASKGKKE